MSLANNTRNKEITEDDVAQYLKSHSGFFLKRDDLLMELQLSHPSSGGAVSLLERQVSLLRERNMDMRSRLSGLLDNARNNDQLFDKTKRLTLSLLEAQGLDAIVNTFTRGLLSDFSMDFASLTLIGSPHLHRSVNSRIVTADDAYRQIPGLLNSNNATSGVLRPEELAFLFTDQSKHVGSAAVVPLNYGRLLGIIAIGSRDPQYFRSSMGTMFLTYIAEVLNRILPRSLHQG